MVASQARVLLEYEQVASWPHSCPVTLNPDGNDAATAYRVEMGRRLDRKVHAAHKTPAVSPEEQAIR